MPKEGNYPQRQRIIYLRCETLRCVTIHCNNCYTTNTGSENCPVSQIEVVIDPQRLLPILISHLSILNSHFSFLNSHFSFLISQFSFLISQLFLNSSLIKITSQNNGSSNSIYYILAVFSSHTCFYKRCFSYF